MHGMTSYCPGDGVGSPGVISIRDADYYERRDRSFIDEMRLLWPDQYTQYPHRQMGMCRKCAQPSIAEALRQVERPKPVICDGCNVRQRWEHRCHGGYNVLVMGQRYHGHCECRDCR